MNGYVVDSDGSLKMWIGRRSLTKPTYPGLLDNTVCIVLFYVIKSLIL